MLNDKHLQEKLKLVTVFGAGLLVGTALSVIIPEGIRSLYMNLGDEFLTAVNSPANVESKTLMRKAPDHARKIGLSLVLGFVFMMLVDQISQKRSRNSADKNVTATIGLVVHAAGKYVNVLPANFWEIVLGQSGKHQIQTNLIYI